MVRENIDVFGISRDACYAHNRFIEEYDLSFPLLSGVEGIVSDRYDVQYDEWELHNGVPKRAIFIIDEKQIVPYRQVSDDAYALPDLTEVAGAIEDLPSVDFDADELV